MPGLRTDASAKLSLVVAAVWPQCQLCRYQSGLGHSIQWAGLKAVLIALASTPWRKFVMSLLILGLFGLLVWSVTWKTTDW